jgi:hypothetical protein
MHGLQDFVIWLGCLGTLFCCLKRGIATCGCLGDFMLLSEEGQWHMTVSVCCHGCLGILFCSLKRDKGTCGCLGTLLFEKGQCHMTVSFIVKGMGGMPIMASFEV